MTNFKEFMHLVFPIKQTITIIFFYDLSVFIKYKNETKNTTNLGSPKKGCNTKKKKKKKLHSFNFLSYLQKVNNL